ncbi:hypothetical protein HPHPM2_0651 [Helicobacter pylori Hp M2]|nr:hypothetical protein HPHPH24B_0680 [Helicobacter pylori Hp H-24b]EJC39696.1 hypothetical protein HPHPM1_0898 [Helicobacter pylori Hp M1]EJC42083.1 hypothetical protein HPHPM2_0651 [Helicobacter pylori Hp M2]EJC43076.1 hypothetical protein HPHPM3_1204 [Helicobacter pylori Hp M3]EJC44768.1 hypothetical protein HPHPM4_1013 [Helicobacter pylori Hp M4]EJC44805.1 hypothetical protein HPHPM6_1728 [Helicobacter pylori Hp M6]EJC46956.1 hypothetical protein HPHPM5_0811 [Helicobacter pylori Hp M5]EJ
MAFKQAINQSINQTIKQSNNQTIKQSNNQTIKQRYHTFIAFTKTYLKIPYFLLFPLLLTLLFSLSLTHTAIFLKNLIR